MSMVEIIFLLSELSMAILCRLSEGVPFAKSIDMTKRKMTKHKAKEYRHVERMNLLQ